MERSYFLWRILIVRNHYHYGRTSGGTTGRRNRKTCWHEFSGLFLSFILLSFSFLLATRALSVSWGFGKLRRNWKRSWHKAISFIFFYFLFFLANLDENGALIVALGVKKRSLAYNSRFCLIPFAVSYLQVGKGSDFEVAFLFTLSLNLFDVLNPTVPSA